MHPQQKISVVKSDTVRASMPREMSDRDFWMSMRHALLQQLAAIEKWLGISRRCRHCGNDL